MINSKKNVNFENEMEEYIRTNVLNKKIFENLLEVYRI